MEKICLVFSILLFCALPSWQAQLQQYGPMISWEESTLPSAVLDKSSHFMDSMNGDCISSLTLEISFEGLSSSSLSSGIEFDSSLSIDGVLTETWKNPKSPIQLEFDPKKNGVYLVESKIGRKKGRWRWTLADEFQQDFDFSVRWKTNQELLEGEVRSKGVSVESCPELTNVYFEFDETDETRTFELQLDETDWITTATPMQFQVLQGSHHLRIRPIASSSASVSPRSFRRLRSLAMEAPDRQDPSGAAYRRLLTDAMDEDDGWMNGNLLIALLVGLVVFLILFFAFLAVYWCRTQSNRRRSLTSSHRGVNSQIVGPESGFLSHGVDVSGYSAFLDASWPRNLKRFRFEDLWAATGGFPENGVLGEGGFGKVYSGTLLDGRSVAVKKLEGNGQQGDREFFVEVTTLIHARHQNILNLLGVCIEDGTRVCVFELMDSGSVRSLLDNANSTFSWKARLRVALGVARGLACLHESVDPPILHRDLKSDNILLDKSGEARISDFGLCTLSHHEARNPGLRRNVAMNVGIIRGTFGYLAPEVINSGKISTKSDVYSVGVVLLELLTGRRPMETSRPSEEQDLVKWVLRGMDDTNIIMETVDTTIADKVSIVQITGFVELAAACLNLSPSARPSALQVSKRLEELLRFKDKTGGGNFVIPHQKMHHLCIDSKLSETSGTIPTTCVVGVTSSCPSEGGQSTPHATTPRTGRSSNLDSEMEMTSIPESKNSESKEIEKVEELPSSSEEVGSSEEQSPS